MTNKILIIEDEAHIRRLLKRVLEMGFQENINDGLIIILEADNGKDGVRIAKEKHPSLIFMDVMMPEMNGFEACKKIKEDKDISDACIIMLTAKGQEIDRLRGEEVGVNEYLTKPFDPDYILLKVEERFNIKRSG